MATIGRDKNGRRRILFVDRDGKRRTVRLGRVDQRTAEAVCRHAEALLSAKLSGQPLVRETAVWVASMGEPLRGRLVKVGLIDAEPACPTLAEWCERYIASRTDAAPRTLIRLRPAAKRLIAYLGPTTTLDRITPLDAAMFAEWHGLGRAANTKRRLAGTAKQILGAAVKARILTHNPFTGIPTTTRPDRSRDVFIDRRTLGLLLDA